MTDPSLFSPCNESGRWNPFSEMMLVKRHLGVNECAHLKAWTVTCLNGCFRAQLRWEGDLFIIHFFPGLLLPQTFKMKPAVRWAHVFLVEYFRQSRRLFKTIPTISFWKSGQSVMSSQAYIAFRGMNRKWGSYSSHPLQGPVKRKWGRGGR